MKNKTIYGIYLFCLISVAIYCFVRVCLGVFLSDPEDIEDIY